MDPLHEKCAKTFHPHELELLDQAIEFAKVVHANQKRESGEPFYIHPAAVAGMLYDMGMDYQTVIAGLLHDVVEDGDNITVEQIAQRFGEPIATMVDGVTKLSRGGKAEYITKEEQQAENLRKMFLAMANDVRVVIIKLVDRLHNMRTLESVSYTHLDVYKRQAVCLCAAARVAAGYRHPFGQRGDQGAGRGAGGAGCYPQMPGAAVVAGGRGRGRVYFAGVCGVFHCGGPF